ncbi:MAG: hypothetical protein JSW02_08825 [candidate division WOR-3 bacterium]|nr:MAG: hypothetical protein JSW02_08825 [candidate division WOR-3 bacterium]
MRLLSMVISLLVVLSIVYADDIEISGDVISVDEISDPVSNADMMRVQLRLQNRATLTVHLCPSWYLDEDIAPGDELTVNGEIDGDSYLVAREMTRNNVRYELRNENLEPLWLRTRLQSINQFYNPLKETQLSGTIEDIYIDKHTNIIESKVRKEDGSVIRVQLAPEWYLQSRVRLGDAIELRGSEVVSDGQVIFLAREMRVLRTNIEIALRNRQGFPDWCGKGEYYNKKQNLPPCCQDDKEGRGKSQN